MAETYFDTDQHDEFKDSEHAKMEFSLWRRLFGYVLHYRLQLALIAFCGLSVGAAEIVFGLVTKWVVDDIQANGMQAQLGRWGVIFVVLSAFQCLVVTGFILCVSNVRAMSAHDIRRDGFLNIQRQSFAFFDRRPVGWLMARLTSDCERLTDILTWAFLDFIWGTTMMLSLGVVMFILNWKLALCAFAIVPLIAFVTLKFRRSILGTAREVRAINSQITGSYNENIMGVLTSKSFVQEEKNLQDFSRMTDRLYKSSVRNLTLVAIYVPTVMLAGSVASGIALAVGGMEFLNGTIIAGTLIAFMIWMRHFFEPTIELAHWFTEFQTAQASAERILAVMDATPDIESGEKLGTPTETTIRTIRFSEVSFDFEHGSGKPILNRINLEVAAGETVALVGPTGGGKTTLVNLLCRFYEPVTGEIALNGIDYRKFALHWYRAQLGVVLQHPHVFSGPILENIRYGQIEAADAEVHEAAKLAGAHEFIESMENGYATDCGAGGSRLSAGQKQLVSIARAFLADPQILILDEATSSVDTSTEQRIQSGLENLFTNRVCFVIAHRLSTIRNADKIAYIRSGQIVEFGTHSELLALQGAYSDIYQQQSLRESVEASFELADRTRN